MGRYRAHVICDACWSRREPDREPVRFRDPAEATCCFCGTATESGIYVREDGSVLRCGDRHPGEDEA